MPTHVSIREVCKTFPPLPGAPKAPTVDRVSLDIEPGELFFLLGPSGCGKTTLLRMIAGFIIPDAGSVRFGDRDVTDAPPQHRNTGMVFQSYALWPHMTVAGNVSFGLEVRKTPADELARRVAEALKLVRMDAYAARKPNQLSGGQQQRVALARALVVRPDVLLLDEPLSNLDAKLRVQLRSEIRSICKAAGMTTVYVTHDQSEALSMADRIGIMNSGRIVQTGPPPELYRRPRSRFVAEFLGETNIIEGTIVHRDQNLAVVNTSIGRLTGLHFTDWGVGASCMVSVRNEAWTLTPQEGWNSAAGQVIESTFLGHVVEIRIRTAGPTLTASVHGVDPRSAPKPGDQVRLYSDPSDAVLLEI